MVINYFKVGCIFSIDFLEHLHSINQRQMHKIYEIYGSTDELSFLVARPRYRLPHISRKDLKEFITLVNHYEITFNYTLNASHIGTKKEIYLRKQEIKEFISFLIGIGIGKFTVSLPIMAQFIREISSSVIIEVSTIAELNSLSQMKIWKECYDIGAICLPLSKNRDIKFITLATKFCNDNKIIIDLMVNEFCSNGCNNIACTTGSCIYRNHCYDLHSANYSEYDSHALNNYPMKQCQSSRINPLTWLKSNFIRPEDLVLYNTIGVNHFKITGRTSTLKYMKEVIDAYIAQQFDGIITELWSDIASLIDEKNNECIIDNKKLEGFLSFWFNNINHNCTYEICGETCSYCNWFYKSIASSED